MDTKLTVTYEATQTMRACFEHATLAVAHWTSACRAAQRLPETGPVEVSIPKQVPGMVESWAKTATSLLANFYGLERTVSRDGDLSLLITGPMTVCAVFHGAHRPDAPDHEALRLGPSSVYMGAYCFTDWCLEPITKGECPTHGATTNVIALPVPGEWSLHS